MVCYVIDLQFVLLNSPHTIPLVGLTIGLHLVGALGVAVGKAVGAALATHEINPHDGVVGIVHNHHNILHRRFSIGGLFHLKVVDTVALNGRGEGEIMSHEKVGALIVFARENPMDEFFKTGTMIDGQAT